MRGTAQNPDVFFQARERAQPVLHRLSRRSSQKAMERFAELTGRQYQLFEYHGAPDAERVIVLMGSGAETVARDGRRAERARREGRRLKVRLYPPVRRRALRRSAAAQPSDAIAVLDRTKEPGAPASRSTSTSSPRLPRR